MLFRFTLLNKDCRKAGQTITGPDSPAPHRTAGIRPAGNGTAEENLTYGIFEVVFEAETGRDGFRRAMARASSGMVPNNQVPGGVRVAQIVEDPSPMKLVYDPTHPDANEDGYVEMPNVDMVKEIADAMAATQAFSSNVTMFNTMKTVVTDALQIGK